jgi:hypothetical protein
MYDNVQFLVWVGWVVWVVWVWRLVILPSLNGCSRLHRRGQTPSLRKAALRAWDAMLDYVFRLKFAD